MKVSDYIDETSIYPMLNGSSGVYSISSDNKSFDIDDIIKICKRKNNLKRDFLFVNKYQGKHIPVEFTDLSTFLTIYATRVRDEISKFEKVAMLGFAETATMLGDFTADYNSCYFRQTTREDVFDFMTDEDKERLTRINFAEEHSHATAQYLYLLKEDDRLSEMDAIVICEDEITTGKTVINLVSKLKPYLKKGCKIYVMSVLNWQTRESLDRFEEYGITPIYLMRGELPADMHCGVIENEKEPCRDYIYDVEKRQSCFYLRGLQGLRHKAVYGTDYSDTQNSRQRVICNGSIIDKVVTEKGWKKICVLGTEEYMYPAYDIAKAVKLNISSNTRVNRDVYFHASTRSPITIADNTPINRGYMFYSAGNMEVINYLYDFDVDDYDGVIVVIGNNMNVDKMNTVDNLVPYDKLIYVCPEISF